MGCFDIVFIKCHHCGYLIENQTKMDKCILATYQIEKGDDLSNIPEAIKEELEKTKVHCDGCRQEWTYVAVTEEIKIKKTAIVELIPREISKNIL